MFVLLLQHSNLNCDFELANLIEDIIMLETETKTELATEESPVSPAFSAQSSSDEKMPSPTSSSDSGIEIGEYQLKTRTRPARKPRTRHNQTKAPNIIHWTAQQVKMNSNEVRLG
jgi:hypothetical protein